MLRIAWITPYLPAPGNSGGRIRIERLARGLSSHELVLFCRLAPEDPSICELPAAELALWSRVHWSLPDRPQVLAPGGTLQRIATHRGAVPPSRRWPQARAPRLAQSFPSSLRRALEDEDRRRPFDLAVVEHCYAMGALVRFERAPIVLSEHNVESDYWLGEFRRTRQLGRLIDYARWRRYERCCWRRADRVTMVTERDAARVRLVRPHGVGVVPNGVTTERFRYLPPSHRQGSDILFVGVMSYEPNVQAAIRLARRVMPRVRRRVPDARLTIAGRDPGPRVRALANERVCVTGAVDDLAALFDRHAAYANLVAFGGGGSLKTLEPLCAGLPLVASPFSIRGYELQPRRHLLLATHDDDVAEALCRVLTERAGFDAMAEQAHAWVQQHDWGIYARRFADFVTAARLGA